AGRDGLRGLAEARHDRLQLAHHQGDLVQARSDRLLGVGRRLRRALQAGAAVRHVRQGEVRDHPGGRRRAARARQGSPRGHHRRRALELPLHVPERRQVAAQQDLRGEVPSALQRVPELPGRGCLHLDLHAQERHREGQQARRRLAGRRRDRRDARGRDDGRPGGLRIHPARQPPGIQGRDHRLQQERAGVSVPDPGSGSHHHDPDPEHHGASRLAEGRADVDVYLDRQDLAGPQSLAVRRARSRGRQAFGSAPGLARHIVVVRPLALVLVLVAVAAVSAEAGHEIPYYPSFYPQEIAFSVADPTAAPRLFAKGSIHAYIGPLTAPKRAADLAWVESLRAFVVLTFNPASRAFADPRERCAAAARLAPAIVAAKSDLVGSPYPVTPWHDDYVYHADLVEGAKTRPAPAGAPLRLRVPRGFAGLAPGPAWRPADREWDATLEEVPLAEL